MERFTQFGFFLSLQIATVALEVIAARVAGEGQ